MWNAKKMLKVVAGGAVAAAAVGAGCWAIGAVLGEEAGEKAKEAVEDVSENIQSAVESMFDRD